MGSHPSNPSQRCKYILFHPRGTCGRLSTKIVITDSGQLSPRDRFIKPEGDGRARWVMCTDHAAHCQAQGFVRFHGTKFSVREVIPTAHSFIAPKKTR